MCGLVGICNLNGDAVEEGLLKAMADLLVHRGPDGEGFHVAGSVGLGHRRLSVIDLTPAGRQPMANETGDVLVVHNGEIFNFRELRGELEARGHRFRSRTDTEVILHAFEEWGDACVERFNGMFAFALWDARCRRLLLARDRHGVKPLYWYLKNGTLVFASEIKAILRHPKVSPEVCYAALNEYFTFQNVFSDLTLFEGVRLLGPGHTLALELGEGGNATLRKYWDYPFSDGSAVGSPEEAADELTGLFRRAVQRQLVSDVPLGGYLSGGMDSGSIVAVAVEHMQRLFTFTAGFDLSSASGLELGFDERAAAEFLANLLKTDHYEVVLHAGDMERVLPELIWHVEDLRVGQCYPNYYVARLASRFVTVVLSGAGGDELFAGYPWRYYRGLGCATRSEYVDQYYRYWQRLVPDGEKNQLFNPDTQRQIAGHSTFDVFRGVFDRWNGELSGIESFVEASLHFELTTFLHGVLVVEDKLSMAHSLETRVPFLDNDLVDFAMRLPVSFKLRNLESTIRIDENAPGKRRLFEVQSNDGKTILRRAMLGIIPSEITERIKQGFSAPDASWFRGESIDYINRLLRNRTARIYEYVEPAYVSRILEEHCSGGINHRLLIWSFLCFEWWCRIFLEGQVPDQVMEARRFASPTGRGRADG